MFIRSVAFNQGGFRSALWALILSCIGGCAVPMMEGSVGTKYSAPILLESNSPDDWNGPTFIPPPPPVPPEMNEHVKIPDTKPFDPFKPKPIGRTSPEVRIVHVYGPTWCKICKTIPDTKRFIKHLEPFPDWVYTKGQWPILHWQGVNGKWYYKRGWQGEKKLNALISTTDDPPPKVQTFAPYPVRGGWWTHPGSVWDHLIQSHGYSSDYVRSLSRAEAESLHSDDHEGRVKGNPPKARRRSTMRYAPMMMRSMLTYCPGST